MMSIDAARSGMTASMMRLNASASNVANADTVGSPDAAASVASGGDAPTVYQPVRVDQRAAPGGGVRATYSATGSPPTLRYDPSSTAADATGMVAAPAIDLADERVQQIMAASDFRANLAVIKTADGMQKATIDLLA